MLENENINGVALAKKVFCLSYPLGNGETSLFYFSEASQPFIKHSSFDGNVGGTGTYPRLFGEKNKRMIPALVPARVKREHRKD